MARGQYAPPKANNLIPRPCANPPYIPSEGRCQGPMGLCSIAPVLRGCTLRRSLVMQMTFVAAMLVVSHTLGTEALAAHSIVAQLWMLTSYIVDGFATAGTILGSRLAAQARPSFCTDKGHGRGGGWVLGMPPTLSPHTSPPRRPAGHGWAQISETKNDFFASKSKNSMLFIRFMLLSTKATKFYSDARAGPAFSTPAWPGPNDLDPQALHTGRVRESPTRKHPPTRCTALSVSNPERQTVGLNVRPWVGFRAGVRELQIYSQGQSSSRALPRARDRDT